MCINKKNHLFQANRKNICNIQQENGSTDWLDSIMETFWSILLLLLLLLLLFLLLLKKTTESYHNTKGYKLCSKTDSALPHDG